MPINSEVKISENFVAFSEYMNFNSPNSKTLFFEVSNSVYWSRSAIFFVLSGIFQTESWADKTILLKFMFSKKATKIDQIFIVDLMFTK